MSEMECYDCKKPFKADAPTEQAVMDKFVHDGWRIMFRAIDKDVVPRPYVMVCAECTEKRMKALGFKRGGTRPAVPFTRGINEKKVN